MERGHFGRRNVVDVWGDACLWSRQYVRPRTMSVFEVVGAFGVVYMLVGGRSLVCRSARSASQTEASKVVESAE